MHTALRPKWLGLLGVAVLVIMAFVQLGRWQLGVAHDAALEEQLARAKAQGVVDLAAVLEPHAAFPGELSARPVSATGRYAADEEVLVTQRRLEGRHGWWVVTALHTDEGAILPVLRGFVTDPAQVTPAPSGRVVVTGGLAPAESPLSGSPTPEGWLRSIDLAWLVNRWPGELYNAFIFLDTETPAPGAGAAAAADLNRLTHVPTPTGETGIIWRNAAYAAQWWIFAAFALWLWWRMVRDEHRRAAAQNPAARHTT